MPRLWTENDPEGMELLKWEQFPSPMTYAMGNKPPGNPYVYREFPKLLYKAHRVAGVIKCMDPANTPEAESFSRSCTMKVNDEREQSRALESGWRPSIESAIEFLKAKEEAVSTAAAERAYRDSKMSEKAQKEAAEADAATEHHLAEIPEKKKRGRPRKVQPDSIAS